MSAGRAPTTPLSPDNVDLFHGQSAGDEHLPTQADTPISQSAPDWEPVNQSLRTLFCAHPSKYSVDDECSKETRGPQFFDLHLKENLRLKRVVLSEDLPRALADFCALKIAEQQRQGNFPRAPLNLTTLSKAILSTPGKICKEDDIRDDYGRRIIDPCIVPASVIAFGGNTWPSENKTPFTWTVNTSVTAAPAQCDGNIVINDNLSELDPEISSLLREHHLAKLVVYEHKNPIAGDKDNLLAATQLASQNNGLFEWITCRSCHFGRYYDCKSKRHSARSFCAESGRKTGPDAADSWIFNQLPAVTLDPGSEGQSILTRSLRHENTRTPWQAANEKPYHMMHQFWSELVQDDATFGVFTSGEYEFIGMRHRESQTLYHSPLIEVAAYAQPGIYHLHTALTVAAYFDARDRVLQLSRATQDIETTMTSLPHPWWLTNYLSVYDSDQHKYIKLPKPRPSYIVRAGKGRTPSKSKTTALTKIASTSKAGSNTDEASQNSNLDESSLLDDLAITSTIHIFSDDNVTSTQYNRKVVDLTNLGLLPKCPPTDGRTGISVASQASQTRRATGGLDIHLGNKKSERVREAFLSRRNAKIPAKSRKSKMIITKFVNDMLGIQELQHEARMYKELKVNGFDLLPAYYGLFADENDQHVLILEHAGEPLAMEKRPKHKHHQYEERQSLIRLLQKLRAAGYIHRSMQLGNVIGKWVGGSKKRRHVLNGLKGVMSIGEDDEIQKQTLFLKDAKQLQQYIDVLHSTPPSSE